MHPPFFSLIIACHFTEVLNCMSNRPRLHAILSISLTKPHLVQLINITPQSISSCDQYMHNYYSSHCIPIHMCTPPFKKSGYGPGGILDRARMSPLQWQIRALLLTCIEGCGLRSNTNRFKVHAAAAGMRTVL